jgi:hypothetical protein
MSPTVSSFGFPRMVNEVSARLVAAGTALLGLACLALGQPWIAALLALEFLARVLTGPRFEPLAVLVTRVITPGLPLAERPTPGPPKRFAQGIGFVVTLVASVLFLAGATTAGYALIAMLVVFATLESTIGLCVGCKAFALLMRVGVVSESVCEECNDLSLRARRLGVG